MTVLFTILAVGFLVASMVTNLATWHSTSIKSILVPVALLVAGVLFMILAMTS